MITIDFNNLKMLLEGVLCGSLVSGIMLLVYYIISNNTKSKITKLLNKLHI